MTYQFATSAETTFQKANFFSFFTIQSSILGVAALIALVLVPRTYHTARFDGARSAAVLYLAITGVVFAWVTYTLVRGEADDWYPYPFVDVSKLGYDGVLARSVGLAAGLALAGAALLWLGNRRART